MISVYIHIPFCNRICTYCDFCKLLKVDAWVNDYLVSLEKEIKSLYRGEEVKTLYIGGGSPSCLNIEQLKKLFDVLSIFKFTSNCEITFEANSGDLTLEKLLFLKDKVNRLSIGIETFNKKYLKLMGRDLNVLNIKAAKQYFDNINLDLLYNLDLQNTLELKEDLKKILELDVPHISAYSLIIEPHTKLFIECYKETTD
ncbi:MAG: radical SAM protein, partial [Bacilli bacterium]|nr:radical SAM protein [Bacilli bacterium]